MRMSRNEKTGRIRFDFLSNVLIVSARIAADMRYPYVKPLTIKALMKRVALAESCAVDIAIDGTEGFEGFELVGEFDGTDISGVPDFVAFLKVFEDLFVKVAVRVGE